MIAIRALDGTTGCSRKAGWLMTREVSLRWFLERMSMQNQSRWWHTFIEKRSQILHLLQLAKSWKI